MFRWMFKAGVITLVLLWARPSLGRRQEGYKQLEDVHVPYGVDDGDGASGRHRHLLRNEADEDPSLEAADRRLPSRRRITSENAFAGVVEGGTTLAVTCRGVEGCAGGEISTEVLTPGSPGKDAGALTSEEGNHDEAQHEVATVPGVATAADFFGGDTIQTNLPNVATTGEQQKQAAGDVSATFTPESVADLLAQLEARKKAKDEDRLCNTEKEQVSAFGMNYHSNIQIYSHRIQLHTHQFHTHPRQSICAKLISYRNVTSLAKISTTVLKRAAMIRKSASRIAALNAARPRIRIYISLRRKKTAVVLAMIKRSTATIAVARKAKIPRRRRNAAVLLLSSSVCAIPPQRDVAESR